MQNLIIGTAGHVDHGKTTLIKALTGIETDTSKEEKDRGLSINLGFAYFDLPSGRRAGVIDVPGHERFLKNMLAGVTGINLVLLVIDAGEGIMPQTREHMDVLTLLGIENFIIVLSKVEKAGEEYASLAEEELREELKGTALEGATIVKTDALTGLGMPELIAEIEKNLDNIQNNKYEKPARINIDRVFSLKGYGAVITGTLLEGVISIGDELMLYPSALPVRVRGIQVHDEHADKAFAGQRTALNLSGIKANEIKRGDVITVVGGVEPSFMVDAAVSCLNQTDVSIKLWDRLRLHIGASEILARAVPLGKDEISAGEEGFIQLRLEEKIVAKTGDRFILRSYSPQRVLAGGEILDANAKKHRRYDDELLNSLSLKGKGDPYNLIEDLLQNSEIVIQSEKAILKALNLSSSEFDLAVEKLLADKKLIKTEKAYMHTSVLNKISTEIIATLNNYHKKNNLAYGMSKNEIRAELLKLAKSSELDMVLAIVEKADDITITANLISLKDYTPMFTSAQEIIKNKIEQMLEKSGYNPLNEDEILANIAGSAEVFRALEEKSAVKLAHGVYMGKKAFDEACAKVRDFLAKEGKITLAEFRDMLSSSRKNSMLILEYMDSCGITRREENYRVAF